MHLPCVRIGELAEFEVDNDQTTEATVEKEQINSEPLIADTQAALPTNESKVTAQLQKEM